MTSFRDILYRAKPGDPTGPFCSENLESDAILVFPGGKAGITYDGGLAVRLTNKTGGASTKGMLVEAASSANNAFDVLGASEVHPIGVVYENGVADGDECWIVVGGRCQVLIKDATAATRANWMYVSDAAGRVDATLAAPPSGGAAELETHMRETGHCLETAGADSDVLVWCILHFN